MRIRLYYNRPNSIPQITEFEGTMDEYKEVVRMNWRNAE